MKSISAVLLLLTLAIASAQVYPPTAGTQYAQVFPGGQMIFGGPAAPTTVLFDAHAGLFDSASGLFDAN